MLRAVIDPNTAALRAEPRDGRDLIIAATNGWIIGLDNLSHLSPWLSDAICRLATGGGFATRELYSDAEEALFDAQRPVILNGIEELATRGDLLDRAIILYLPAIPEDKRRPEKDLWRDFESHRASILGALLDAVSTALRTVDSIKLDRLPRMADFAIWASAAAPMLDYTPESFLAAYAGNREAAHELTLEANVITLYVRSLAEKGCMGTASELLRRLDDAAADEIRRQKTWSTNGRALSNALRRMTPNLRAVGVDVRFTREGKRGTRTITLSRMSQPSMPDNDAKTSSASSASSATQENRQVMADATADAKLPADARLTQAHAHISRSNSRIADEADAADAGTEHSSSDVCSACGGSNWQDIPGGDQVCITCLRRTA